MRYRGTDDRMTASERAAAWLANPANVARAHKLTIRAASIEARTNVAAMQAAANGLVAFKERVKK